jgi:hypothetical protein
MTEAGQIGFSLDSLWLFGQANDHAVGHEFEQAGSE